MSAIEYDDPRYHVDILSDVPVDNLSRAFLGWKRSLANLVSSFEPISLLLVDNLNGTSTYTLTATGRSYVAVLNPAGRFRTATTGPFTQTELLSHSAIIESVLDLIELSVTSIEVIWS